MFTKAFLVAFLATLPLASSSPTLKPREVDSEIWTAVPWRGSFVYYKTASVQNYEEVEIVPAKVEAVSSLRKREDLCDEPTQDPAPVGSPYAYTSDCIGLRDWLNAHGGAYGNWAVPGLTGGAYEIIRHGTCAFAAGTSNYFLTLIGNENMADLLTGAINSYNGGGYLGARGTAVCFSSILGTFPIRWEVGQTGQYDQSASGGEV